MRVVSEVVMRLSRAKNLGTFRALMGRKRYCSCDRRLLWLVFVGL
jgi:hypothetical protein